LRAVSTKGEIDFDVSPNRDAALKLIVHWTSADMQLFQATGAGYLPV